MDFTYTPEQQMVRDTIRDFALAELAAGAAERDEKEIFPHEAIRKLGELGFMGVTVPPEEGGSGLDMISYAIAVEELARVDASCAIIVSVNNSLVCYPLEKFATPEQKERLLKPLASGGKLGAFALSEPGSGSDAGAMKTTAVRDGDDYILNGTKNFITTGANSDVMIVFAVTDANKGSRGTSAYLIEKGMKGFEVGRHEKKLGIRASDCVQISLVDCRVPIANLLGGEGMGFKIALTTLNSGRIGVAAQALGIAQASLDEAVKYSQERRQFGQPLSAFQITRAKIARMAMEIEAARLLLHSACARKDRGESFIKEAAMAKLYCSELAVRTALEAVQIHGGYGYIKEYPVERYLRDSKITTIYEGTNEVMHLVIAEQILGRE
ncbi:MAG: acyl-CoA dehydrogenase [Calditrichaeota bacterium]|nr:acyl-CoA dehydrogenase [Calditrichota bacterium]